MTPEDIVSYCEFNDCEISAGSPEIGFVHFSGSGPFQGSHTYVRFNMLHELAHSVSPRTAVDRGTVFKLQKGGASRALSREEFQRELDRFHRLIR